MRSDFKRLSATVLTGVVAVIVTLDALLDIFGLTRRGTTASVLQDVAFVLVNWGATLIALALLIGIISVSNSHIKRLRQRAPDWQYSIILLVGMFAVIIVGIIGIPDFSQGVPRFELQTLAEEPIRLFFRTFYEPLASSLLALLAFFSLSAMLRSTRQRNSEAWVIVITAVIVLFTQFAPIAALPYVSDTMRWINEYIVTAGARGLLIGVAIGTLVASIRVLLGFDQPYLDR
ncbi:MAG: hypothetical protein HC876_06040 [Chloroflexaceae bacterium]|nr:hypothetical protein [Chloroflexaceae bacterium]NJO05104.1 hypothetical protein [Chloroflexaceae bacterium]